MGFRGWREIENKTNVGVIKNIDIAKLEVNKVSVEAYEQREG